MNDTPTPAIDAPPTRQRAFLVLGACVVLGALLWGGYWLLFMRHYESTDDAYVAADIVQITSEVAGTVTAVHVDDTQAVQRGELLVELDAADAALAVATAEAELAQTVRDVSALFARKAQLSAELASRQVALQRARSDLQRRQPLSADGAVSSEELAHAADAVSQSAASVTAAQAELEALEVRVHGTTVSTHPQVLRAAANLRNAQLALRRTRLIAPIGGTVARRNVQLGERVAPGAPLLALISLDDVWIDANLKEVQIGRIRVGQPATIRADVYGSDVEYHGRVAGLAAGSGTAFALLPAQNATGNWIKIVQRVPVRIALDAREVRAHPLRVGTSTTVRIDVGGDGGQPLGGQGTVAAPPLAAPATPDATNPDRVQQIIDTNSQIPARWAKQAP